MAGEMRIRARQLQNGKAAGNIALLFVKVLLTVLPFALTLVLQLSLNGSLAELAAKAVLLLALALAFPCAVSLFRISVARHFFLRAEDKTSPVRKTLCFFNFRRFFGALKFSLCFYALKLACGIVCFLPVFIFGFGFYAFLSAGSSLYVVFSLAVCLLLLICVCTFFYYKILRLFFLSKYIFACRQDIKIKTCFETSAKIMHKSTGTLFRLRLSFALWFSLCVLLLPLFYVWGYYEQTMAVFAQKKLEAYFKENNIG